MRGHLPPFFVPNKKAPDNAEAIGLSLAGALRLGCDCSISLSLARAMRDKSDDHARASLVAELAV